jgi:hypothetical protein
MEEAVIAGGFWEQALAYMRHQCKEVLLAVWVLSMVMIAGQHSAATTIYSTLPEGMQST